MYRQRLRTDTHSMRTTRIISLIAVLIALVGASAQSASVRADQPLRSGTIVSGTGETPANPWVTGMEGCVGAPTCSAWLQSGCAPALAGVDPALQASIVDVADLADGVTVRRIQVQDDAGLNGGPRIIQFWRGNGMDEYDVVNEPAGLDGQGCKELLAHRLDRWDGWTHGSTFRIPATARFMTISSSTDSTNTTWTLT